MSSLIPISRYALSFFANVRCHPKVNRHHAKEHALQRGRNNKEKWPANEWIATHKTSETEGQTCSKWLSIEQPSFKEVVRIRFLYKTRPDQTRPIGCPDGRSRLPWMSTFVSPLGPHTWTSRSWRNSLFFAVLAYSRTLWFAKPLFFNLRGWWCY